MKRLFASAVSKVGKCGALLLLLTAMCNVALAQSTNPNGGTPEIDPSAMVGALALATTGMLMLTDRVRHK
jgi:hypothetical protein